MKILIWFLCILANSSIIEIIEKNGVILGGIPTFIMYTIMFAVAESLCKKWEAYERNRQKKITNAYVNSNENDNTQTETPNFKISTVCIYDTIDRSIRNEERTIDINKFPTEKYAVDGTYYAIEKMNNDKKVRVYCSKSSWQSQVDNQNVNTSKIKFCRKCGIELIDDSKFCGQCGTKIV